MQHVYYNCNWKIDLLIHHVVQYLHINGADIRVRKDKPLIWASKNGHLAVVQYLHINGADI